MTDTPTPDIRVRLMQAIIQVLVDGDPIMNIGFGSNEITLNWISNK